MSPTRENAADVADDGLPTSNSQLTQGSADCQQHFMVDTRGVESEPESESPGVVAMSQESESELESTKATFIYKLLFFSIF